MTREDFIVLATDCGFEPDVDCRGFDQLLWTEAVAFVNTLLQGSGCPCGCIDANCYAVYYYLLSEKEEPSAGNISIRNKVEDMMHADGVYGY